MTLPQLREDEGGREDRAPLYRAAVATALVVRACQRHKLHCVMIPSSLILPRSSLKENRDG